MEKTIKIGKQEVRLSNNVSWAIIYRDQFGRDIIPTLMPMLAGALDVVSGLAGSIDANGRIELRDVLADLDGDKLIDAMIHLSGLEFVDFINITWAMAKACNDDIPEPRTWVRGFDNFPVDTIAPEVFRLVFRGLVSSKNLKRLKDLTNEIKVIRPTLTPTQSSSPDSNED